MGNNQSRVTRHEYDSENRRTKIIDPSGKEDVYVFDGNGCLLESIDRNGNRTKNTYNCLGGKLDTQVLAPTNTLLSKKEFTYNQAGDIATATENRLTISYTYDDFGRVLQEAESSCYFLYKTLGLHLARNITPHSSNLAPLN